LKTAFEVSNQLYFLVFLWSNNCFLKLNNHMPRSGHGIRLGTEGFWVGTPAPPNNTEPTQTKNSPAKVCQLMAKNVVRCTLNQLLHLFPLSVHYKIFQTIVFSYNIRSIHIVTSCKKYWNSHALFSWVEHLTTCNERAISIDLTLCQAKNCSTFFTSCGISLGFSRLLE